MSAATEAHIEIQQLVHRYADAVIHRNGAQWTSTWAPEAEWDLGGGRLVEGVEAISALWHKAMGGFEATIQTVLNGETHLGDSGETASGRWYIQEHVVRSGDKRSLLLAHYEDEYRKVEGSWKFTRRLLEPHYNGATDLSDEFNCTGDKLRARSVEGITV
jgi:hypothetical protein